MLMHEKTCVIPIFHLYFKVYVCAHKRDKPETAFKRAGFFLHLNRCPTKCAIEDFRLDHAVYKRGPRKFCQRGFNFDNVFLVDERIQIRAIIDPPAKRYLHLYM